MSEDKTTTGTDSSHGDRMTDAQFASARERYELGTDTLIDLSDEFGVSRQAMSARFKRNGVKKGSRAHEVAAAASKGAKSAAAASAASAERFHDLRNDWIEETRINGVQALKQARLIAQKTIVDEMKRPAPNLGNVEDGIKTISRYSKMLADNLETALRILKSDDHVDEESLPSLVIEDLTNQEILDHHIGTGALPEDATLEDMLHEEDFEIEGVK